MIEFRFGKYVKDFRNRTVRNYLLVIGYGGIAIFNKANMTKRFFLKWAKGHFAICRPVKLKEGECVKYVFGWNVHPRINYISDCYDLYKFDIRLWNKELLFKR